MAGAAGRRNILREISALGDRAGVGNFQNPSTSSAATSPEEIVIRERGCQRKSATYTFGAPDPVFFKTPTKSPKKTFHQRLDTPTKTPVRSSPRKRLATPEKLELNEESIAEITLLSKHAKIEPLTNVEPSTQLERGLKALSHAQLVNLISLAVQNSPEAKQVISDLIPVPDLLPLEQRLYNLQHNIFKAFPRNVWGSQDSSFCYTRVRTHLEAFKKECLDMCSQLMESHHWPAIFEYILMAWKFTDGLPNWDCLTHNKIKSVCMKQLAAQCISAMKSANLNRSALTELIERMKKFEKDSAVKICIQLATDLIEKAA